MNNRMTVVSERLYDQAVSGSLTASEAVDFLEREAKMRTLREKLEKFSHGQELRPVLVQGLTRNHPDAKKDAVERRVRGWLNNPENQTLRKNDAIELCFILGLSVEEADAFVALVSEEGLHWRNPDEIVYIFALKQGMDYSGAKRLNDEMGEILSKVTESRMPAEDSFTPIIRAEAASLSTREELADYLKGAVSRLGRYHNNAYKLFMDMMEALEHPELYETEEQAGLFERERLTIRDVLREYLFGENVLYAKGLVRDKHFFTVIQKEVSKSWPDESTISKMKSRKTDVTRKVLILLFLATDPGPGDEEDEGDEDREGALSGEKRFEQLYQSLNDMLLQCGFQPIDPRSPFDWLILYCICTGDMFEVDKRMKMIFKEMFGERPKNGQKAGEETDCK